MITVNAGFCKGCGDILWVRSKNLDKDERFCTCKCISVHLDMLDYPKVGNTYTIIDAYEPLQLVLDIEDETKIKETPGYLKKGKWKSKF